MILAHGFYFLIAKLSFSLIKNIVLNFTQFYLRKSSQIFWSSVFHQSVSFNWEKKTETLWVWFGAFKVGILGLPCTLQLAWIEKHYSKVFSLISILQVSWVFVQLSLDVVWLGFRMRLVTCELQLVTSGCYFVTFQACLVDCEKILQGVGRGFLPRLGSRYST